MRLKLQNFAKIGSADVIIEGITVIAGKNNTGKSTIGKVLFGLFNALNNPEKKLENEKHKYVYSMIFDFVTEEESKKYADSIPLRRDRFMARKGVYMISRDIMDFYNNNELITTSDIIDVSSSYISKLKYLGGLEELTDKFKNIAEKIKSTLEVGDYKILKEITHDTFSSVFFSQINFLGNEEEFALVIAEIKDKKIELRFQKHECISIKNSINLNNKAIYIDALNTFANLPKYRYDWDDLYITERYLAKMLFDKYEVDQDYNTIGRIINKEKLAEIFKVFNEVVDADLLENRGEYLLRDKDVPYAVKFGNLSLGVRAFVVLKMLIEKNLIKEKDIIIFDEPEIHLHPQWQIIFAHLLVLIQKVFDLRLVVTTHSHFFVDAIDLYARKYKISHLTNYYLSGVRDQRVEFTEVSNCQDELYASMSEAVDSLNDLREELEKEGK